MLGTWCARHVPRFLKGQIVSEKFPIYKDEFLYLTTTGRKSGLPHEIEIWFVAHNGCYYLCAEHYERTHWVQNILHNPVVSFYVDGRHHQGTGRTIDRETEPELGAAVAGLFDSKYQWSEGLLVELCPEEN
jgi:deazaflavin-dependent oxidoreductase (nitroreductase family)